MHSSAGTSIADASPFYPSAEGPRSDILAISEVEHRNLFGSFPC